MILFDGRAVEKAKRKQTQTRAEADGASPQHAQAEGAAAFHAAEQQRLDAAKAMGQRGYLSDGHARQSPSNAAMPAQPDFRTDARVGYDGHQARPVTAHGIRVEQLGGAHPTPQHQTTLNTVQGGVLGPMDYAPPGSVTVQHMAAADVAGFRAAPSASPVRPDFHQAPSGATPPQPRATGPAAASYPFGRN